MNTSLSGQRLPPLATQPHHWFVFRVREQMYAMPFGSGNFALFAIGEDRESDFDAWCRNDQKFSYIRLAPHPTDEVLGGLLTQQASPAVQRDFLARHAPSALEAITL